MPLDDYYLNQIMGFEGDPRTKQFYQPVNDQGRQLTIGYGTRYTPGMDTSLPGLRSAFHQEIGDANQRVRSFLGDRTVTPGQEAALTDLTYNAGPKWMSSGLGQDVLANNWDSARQRFLQYTSPDPRVQAGLYGRRLTGAQWLAPNYSAPAAPGGAAPVAGWEKPMALGIGPTIAPQVFEGRALSARTPDPPPMPPPSRPQFGPPEPFGPFPPNADDPNAGFGYGIPQPADPNAAFGYGVPSPPGVTPNQNFGFDYGIPSPTNLSPPADKAIRVPSQDVTPGVVPPPAAGVSPPVTPSGQIERRGPDGGMAPAVAGGGGGFSALLGGPIGRYFDQTLSPNNSMLWSGLGLLAGMKPEAALASLHQGGAEQRANAELAIRQQEALQKETAFQQAQDQFLKEQQIFGTVFPNGQPNMDHPLLKGLTPQMAQTIYAMGPQLGLKLLGQYSLSDAEKQADIERRLSTIGRIQTMFPKAGQQPATGQPGATAGVVGGTPVVVPQQPPAAPQGRFAAPGGSLTGGATLPPGGATSPPAPIAAAPAPTPGGGPQTISGRVPGVPAEPMIDGRTLSQARDMARALRAANYPDTILEEQIKNAEKEATVPSQVKERAAKVDQAYEAIGNALDNYQRLVRKVGRTGMYGGIEKEAVDRARADLFLQTKDLYNLGVPQAGDLALMAQLIADPNTFDLAGGLRANKNYHVERVDQSVADMRQFMLNMRNSTAGAIGQAPIAAPAREPAPLDKTAPTSQQAASVKRPPDEIKYDEQGKKHVRYGDKWYKAPD